MDLPVDLLQVLYKRNFDPTTKRTSKTSPRRIFEKSAKKVKNNKVEKGLEESIIVLKNKYCFYGKHGKCLDPTFVLQGYSLKCTKRYCIIFLMKSQRLVYKSVAPSEMKKLK